jgi:SAM-dependent methyltransferase
MTETLSRAELLELIDEIGERPDAAQYRRLSGLVMDDPAAHALAAMEPFSAAYRDAAVALYLDLRGRQSEGYEAARDEASTEPPAKDLFRGPSPWGFQDPDLLAEFMHCWGHMIRRLDLKPGGGETVLEYGPGSGQLLLALARLGVKAHAVDIDRSALEAIEAQAAAMKLEVATERAGFGEGFGEQRFDRIVFFEAFHHALEFEALLDRLQERLAPGGILVFCGEPVVGHPTGAVPFPWGPRLDALSVFCIRRYGWMELGFTHDFFVELLRRHGWKAEFHLCEPAGRGSIYTARRISELPPEIAAQPVEPAAKAEALSFSYKLRWKIGKLLGLPMR